MISTQNPDALSTEAVISEINSLQDEIRVQGRRMYELAHSLYKRTRKTPADDSTAIYITYANAITRFAGVLEQATIRTARVARVLKRLPEKVIEEPQKKKVMPQVESQSPIEALISSYTESPLGFPEVVDDNG